MTAKSRSDLLTDINTLEDGGRNTAEEVRNLLRDVIDSSLITETDAVGSAYAARSTENATDLLNNLEDGEVGLLEGVAYRKDSAVPLGDSATEDLGVAGLVAASLISIALDAFGATGSNAAADQAAALNAIAAVPAEGGIIALSDGRDYLLDVAAITTAAGAKKILWTGGGTVNGTIYPDLPGLVELWNPENNRRVFYEGNGAPNSFVRYDFQRKANYSGGVTGVTSILRAYTIVEASAGQSGQVVSEWPFQARVDNYSDEAHGVANTGQARRFGLGPVWSLHGNTIDNIDPSLSTDAAWGGELNIQGNFADPSNLRKVLGLIAHNVALVYSGTPGQNVIGQGLDIYPHTADYNYGIRIRTFGNPGVTTGRFEQAALRIDAVAPDLIQAFHPSEPALLKYGTKRDFGIVGQLLAGGNNNAAAAVFYSEIRTRIANNNSGIENGVMELRVQSAGSREVQAQLTGDASDPFEVRVGGVLSQVTRGAADSGGPGFRTLLVAN